jgi:hypothetical protein
MASAVIDSSPSNVLLYRVKKGVDGTGAERIKYAGSLQGGRDCWYRLFCVA